MDTDQDRPNKKWLDNIKETVLLWDNPKAVKLHDLIKIANWKVIGDHCSQEATGCQPETICSCRWGMRIAWSYTTDRRYKIATHNISYSLPKENLIKVLGRIVSTRSQLGLTRNLPYRSLIKILAVTIVVHYQVDCFYSSLTVFNDFSYIHQFSLLVYYFH